MTGFTLAYWIVWLGVVAYMARLGAEQRRLSRALETLRVQTEDPHDVAQSAVKAA